MTPWISRLCDAAVVFPQPGEFDSHLRRFHHGLVLVGLEKKCDKCTIVLSELERIELRDVQSGGASSQPTDLLTLVAVDAREHKHNIRDFEVTQVPQLLWFSSSGGAAARVANLAARMGRGVIRRQRLQERGLPVPEPFPGTDFSAASISDFLNARLGPNKTFVRPKNRRTLALDDTKTDPSTAAIRSLEFVGMTLNDRTFYPTVHNPDTFSLVLFCNSWNQECKDFRDTSVPCLSLSHLRAESGVSFLVNMWLTSAEFTDTPKWPGYLHRTPG